MRILQKPSLNEVKKGQLGTGLLIENDGHIRNDCDAVLQLKEDIQAGHKYICPDHFIVDAIFQKYGVKNANDRIYPENVLRPEVERYIKANVERRCAYGALDHPSCQLAGTLVLTDKGWKDIADVKVGDMVLTVNKHQEIEVHPVLRKIDEPYSGKMIRLRGDGINICVTPNHKFPVLSKGRNWKGLFTAQEIKDRTLTSQSHCGLFRNGVWTADETDTFTLEALNEDELSQMTVKTLRARCSKPINIPMMLWMRFLGLYIGGGEYKLKFHGSSCGISLVIYDENAVSDILSLMNELPLKYDVHKFRRGFVKITIHDARLVKHLAPYGDFDNRKIPEYVFSQSADCMRAFYDGLCMSDSTKRGTGLAKYHVQDFLTPSKELALGITDLLLRMGYCGRYHEVDINISQKSKKRMYGAYKLTSPLISLSVGNMSVTEEHYDGRVYCIEVENHTFYTMDTEGNCLWSGNSSSLSGHDVAMNIVELHWEGNVLVGKLELNTSIAYQTHGSIETSGDQVANLLRKDWLVGVSSRGVGTVRQMPGGIVTVEDDFSLICWDVVLEPSTPGAYIGKTKEELAPYMESKNNSYFDRLFTEKVNRIESLLNG